MMKLLNSSDGGGPSNPKVKRAESSGESMKTNWIIQEPLSFSSEGGSSKSRRMKTQRSFYPVTSYMSLKSEDWLPQQQSLLALSGLQLGLQKYRAGNRARNRARPPEPLKRRNTNLLQDQSRCGLCEQLQTDPVSITCGHSFCRLCINRYSDKTGLSGDFTCPSCRKRSKTRPALHPHTEESMKPDSYQLEDDVLQSDIQKHKTCMKIRYKSLFEGIKTQENRTLLNRIYTQLYIIEGESEGVNKEHEVIQMEKTSNKYLQETPINCLDIFRPVEEPEEEMEIVIVK